MQVLEAIERCGGATQGLVTAAALRADGITRSRLSRALADGHLARVRSGVYAAKALGEWPVFLVTHKGVAPEFLQQVRAVLLSLGPGAAAGGTTAACLRGWGLLVEPLGTVQVAVPATRGRTRLAGVRVIRRRKRSTELITPLAGSDAVAVTSALATVLDSCADLPLLDGVVLVDSALRSGQVTLAELQQATQGLRGRRRASRVRRALELCDPESGSVLESVLRVRMAEDGLVGFGTQLVIRDASGRYVRRVDFCFETVRLVLETDGARWHEDSARDQSVDNRLAAAGWRVLRFTWAQVVHDPEAVLALIRAAVTVAGSLDTQLEQPTSPARPLAA